MSLSVLVTGGAGFIGSHLAEALLKLGYAVTVLDNLASGQRQYQRQYIPSSATFLEGDISHLPQAKLCTSTGLRC